MLSVRQRYYCPEDEFEEEIPVVLYFKRNFARLSLMSRGDEDQSRTDDRRGHIELKTFDEQRGF